jgi:hypothetical protein
VRISDTLVSQLGQQAGDLSVYASGANSVVTLTHSTVSGTPGYGVVTDHPELVDINFGDTKTDWMHTNSIDYNEKFDQILISVHNFNEIWVIDHSTTTEEAAGHTGGNSGKGGDLLYRWGNPQAYERGTASDQQLFLQDIL